MFIYFIVHVIFTFLYLRICIYVFFGA